SLYFSHVISSWLFFKKVNMSFNKFTSSSVGGSDILSATFLSAGCPSLTTSFIVNITYTPIFYTIYFKNEIPLYNQSTIFDLYIYCVFYTPFCYHNNVSHFSFCNGLVFLIYININGNWIS